jgi:hypothetical protein
MRTLKVVGMTVLGLAIATTGMAQRTRQGARDGSGPAIDTARIQVVEGVVVHFVAGLGQGMPELQVTDAAGTQYAFVLGPYWYLADQGFAADPGDAVTVVGYACASCDTGIAVASVVNGTKGITLGLRDEYGLPLWTSRQPAGAGGGLGGNGGADGGTGGSRGNGGGGGTPGRVQGGGGNGGNGGNGGGAGCTAIHDGLILDLSRTTTFTATVASFTLTAGRDAATLVAATSSGEVSFLVAPAWVLLRAEFTPEAGDALEIVAAPATVGTEEVWVVLSTKDAATGLELVLRDPATGFPVARGARRGRL